MSKKTGNPPGRPPKSGAYSGKVLVPITEEKTLMIRDLLTGQAPVVGPADRVMVELLARNLAKIEVIDRWLQVHGLFDEGGNPQAVLKVYWQAMNSANRQCDALALTPASRIRLGLAAYRSQDFAAAMAEVPDGED